MKQIRAQDLVWLLLFAALGVFGPERTPIAITLLIALALFQIVESKIPELASERGVIVSVLIKLLLAYLLIAYTAGIASSYYFILLLPVVSAATSLGMVGTVLFILLACGAYLSFLWFLPDRLYIPEDQVKELYLRVALLPVVGFLTQQLAESSRARASNYQAVAEQLAVANQSLRHAEAAVRRADRLAALGQLTAGLAHELRNPMSTIRNSAEMLANLLPQDNEVGREVAGYITSEVDRTNSLITRFLEFSRPLKLRLEDTAVTAVIDRAVIQLERQMPGVRVYKNYSPDVRPVQLDAELMERVFYNLLINAAQASRQGAPVTVKTRESDGGVEIAVIDTGSGIDPANLESIFNPFFTTKSDGVGLGLAIVSKIVDEHSGKIVVESHPGEGSVFRVYLPAKQKAGGEA